jgi:hypothetical protein
MHADWECRGSKKKINEKWFGPIITKVLITARWRLNNLIDAGCPKPAEVKDDQWNHLLALRKTEESKKKSEHMRAISKGKGSKTAQLKAIEKAALIKLVRSMYCFPRILSLYVL